MKVTKELLSSLSNEMSDLSEAWARKEFRQSGARNIVVIDDCRETLQFVSKVLSKDRKLSVSLFDDELRAMEIILKDSPDLIILDINLNTLDGIKVSQVLESLMMFRVPILFVTGDEIFIQKIKKTNPRYTMVRKPIDRNTLLSLVNEMLFSKAA